MPPLKRATPLSPENIRGTDINGKAVVLAKTQPQQLALFQTFFPDDHTDHYSNTIELYDAIPKYVTNPKLVDAMREGGKYLPLLERPHMHSTLLVVPDGQPCPLVGDRVDVQRPLIATNVDEVEWT